MNIEQDYILQIENLTKTYDKNNVVLNQVNLNVKRNEFVCILGPSGCGKTTLLRCLAGFEDYEGKILINEKEKLKPGQDCIMVFQDFNQLFPWRTVGKNIEYALQAKGVRDKNIRKQIAKESLKKVKLEEFENYYPHQLSGGMKQRVAIAKALALKPEIILMDEPFAALDAMTRNQLQAELLKIFENEKCTIVFITHNIQEAIVLGTRIIVLQKQGKIAIDECNPIERPVTPASVGYGTEWEKLHEALYQQ